MDEQKSTGRKFELNDQEVSTLSAVLGYEACRQYKRLFGDDTVQLSTVGGAPSWDELTQEERNGYWRGSLVVMSTGGDLREMHCKRVQNMRDKGWVWGELADTSRKVSPLVMDEFDELPFGLRAVNHAYCATVMAVHAMRGQLFSAEESLPLMVGRFSYCAMWRHFGEVPEFDPSDVEQRKVHEIVGGVCAGVYMHGMDTFKNCHDRWVKNTIAGWGYTDTRAVCYDQLYDSVRMRDAVALVSGHALMEFVMVCEAESEQRTGNVN
jgi:hypothetical protein